MRANAKSVLAFSLALLLVGCASQRESVSRQPLVQTETTAMPTTPVSVVSSPGSLVPVSQLSTGAARGLFEDKRATQVGDTLTVILNETTSATKGGSTNASRKSANKGGVDVGFSTTTLSNGVSTNNRNTIDLGAGVSGNTGFDSRSGSSQSNQFSGTITVTVIERLPNGNLRVAGEKKLAVGAEEEVIRFGGVVSPLTMRGNTVLSSYVADARIEYRGAGVTDEVQRPGWLTQLFMRYFPQ
jgi:flagellar L-ring protein FlgH